jgi:hypothetical protein
MGRFTNGWVKAHRDILDKDLNQNCILFALWNWLLLAANYRESQIIWNGEQRILKRGELVLGIKNLAEQWQISSGSIRKWLKYLEKTERILIQSCTRGTVVTICNYDKYQGADTEAETPNVNGVRTECKPNVSGVHTECKPNVNQVTLIEEVKKGRREEGKKERRKENTIGGNRRGIRIEYPDVFDQLWTLYEKKGDKKAAYEEFSKLKLSEGEIEQLSLAIKNYKKMKPDRTYRKDLERYLKTDWREHLDTQAFSSVISFKPKSQSELLEENNRKTIQAFLARAAKEVQSE